MHTCFKLFAHVGIVVTVKHVKHVSGGILGQFIVRVIASLVSIATALVVNSAPAFKVENRWDFKNVASKVANIADSADGENSAELSDNGTNTVEEDQLNAFSNGDSRNDSKLPKKVASSFTNKDEVVSSKYAIADNGELKSLKTGQTVTDSKLVGTKDKQPDPLAKSNGERFTPITVGDLRKEIKRENSSSTNADSSTTNNTPISSKKRVENKRSLRKNKVVLISSNQKNPEETDSNEKSQESQALESRISTYTTYGSVRKISLPTNGFGTRWGDYNGTQAFYDGNGSLFAYNASGVIDVSEYQKEINWAAAKAAGVEGAIIRISYGWENGYDKYALRNIRECKRLGIPFGIYMYSYAEKPEDGANEGADVASLLRRAGVSPGDLSYPVYYDLEKWVWAGHTAPTSPYVYQNIVSSWWNQLYSAGYTNLGIYSYANYLRGPLNSQYIHDRASWVASYGATPLFNIRTALRGWQYTSKACISGIDGNVDVSAFGTGPNSPVTQTNVDFTWIIRNNDIAVGAAVTGNLNRHLEYRWLSYDLYNKQWRTISDWSVGNWASWVTSNGDYWLHCEVRDAYTYKSLGTKTIAFRYQVNNPVEPEFVEKTIVSGTYAAWQGSSVLLGAVTNNPSGYTIIKIYDYNAKQWVSQFKGPWALWSPHPGIYWTHFEAYSKDGKLQDTKTYAFGV